MKEYEIVVAAYEKNYLRVMANSEKEALEIVERNISFDGYLVGFDNTDTEIIFDGDKAGYESYVIKHDE